MTPRPPVPVFSKGLLFSIINCVVINRPVVEKLKHLEGLKSILSPIGHNIYFPS